MKLQIGDLVLVRALPQIDNGQWCHVGTIIKNASSYNTDMDACIEEDAYIVEIDNFQPRLVYRDFKDLVPISKDISENKLKALKKLTEIQ